MHSINYQNFIIRKARYPQDVSLPLMNDIYNFLQITTFKFIFYFLTSSLSFTLDPSNCMLAEAKLEGKIWLRKRGERKKIIKDK